MSTHELSQQQIDELRDSLQTWKQELESHLQNVAADTLPVTLDQQSVGRVSRIDAIQQQQMARANQEQASLNLKRVEFALRRIESDEYGLCLHCEEVIAFARLQAQPFATLCIECQSLSESG
jgi:DnaK suppressor protein